MTLKAQGMADKFFPDDPEKNKVCADSILIGVFETIDLVFN
jgi:hypothetical protein